MRDELMHNAASTIITIFAFEFYMSRYYNWRYNNAHRTMVLQACDRWDANISGKIYSENKKKKSLEQGSQFQTIPHLRPNVNLMHEIQSFPRFGNTFKMICIYTKIGNVIYWVIGRYFKYFPFFSSAHSIFISATTFPVNSSDHFYFLPLSSI